jgi:NitT/TauT family transport system substrate-binding protein
MLQKWRVWRVFFGVLAVSVLLPAAGASADEYVMRLTLGSGLCEAPMVIAVEKGYFDEEGLKYEITRTVGLTNTLPELIASGKIDGCYMMLPLISLQLNNGIDFRIACGVHKGCLALLAPVDSEIRTAADLKGKIVGVPGIGSSPMLITQRALMKAGVDARMEAGEVEFLSFNGSDLPLALKNGSVDAIALGEPNASFLVEQGLAKMVFDTAHHEDYKDEICCAMVFNTNFANSHPEVAVKFLKALRKACDFIRENTEEASRIQIDAEYVALGNLPLNTRLNESFDYRATVSGGIEAFRTNLIDLQNLKLLNAEFDIDTIMERYVVRFDGFED